MAEKTSRASANILYSQETEDVLDEADSNSERAGRQGGGGGMEDILLRLWTALVQPILERIGYTVSSHSVLIFDCLISWAQKATGRDRPRLWWCPTGETVFLPLHAAGKYKGNVECTSDYVVSSYIPNLSVLVDALDKPIPSKSDAKVLLVSQPRARRQRLLYSTAKEIQTIAGLAPPNSLLHLGSSSALDPEGDNTTVENVLATLPQASIVHLACHALQDLDDSLDSGFEMRDDRLTVLKLMHLKMPHAFFAFLSACQSATGAEELPDETVGLATTMLFVGFRSVVGTMW